MNRTVTVVAKFILFWKTNELDKGVVSWRKARKDKPTIFV
jgi:hypothetical protein